MNLLVLSIIICTRFIGKKKFVSQNILFVFYIFYNQNLYFTEFVLYFEAKICISMRGVLYFHVEGLAYLLTHWGRVTHICVSNLTIIASDNGLSPDQRQAITWTNAGILLIGHLGTNFSKISIKIYSFSFKKMHLKMLSGKWRPSCLGLNVLITVGDRPCYHLKLLVLSCYAICNHYLMKIFKSSSLI